MNPCKHCGGKGIVLICYVESNDYDAAACLCEQGKWWRTKYQLKAWAAQQTPPPVRVGRLEDFYTAKAIAEHVGEDGPSIAEMFGS